MFASRTDWNLQTNPLTTLVSRMRLKGESILDLTESNPTRCGLVTPSGFLRTLADPQTRNYDPDPKGVLTARLAVSEYYGRQGVAIDAESILLTSSTSEAYSFLFRLLCNTGDRVLIPRPGYPLFDILAGLHDIETVGYDLVYDGEWHIDRDALAKAVNSRTRAILLLHPSNPAGSYVKQEEREFLAEIALRHEIPLIVDEVFHSYPMDPNGSVPATFAANNHIPLFVLNGLSKLAGMPQLKIAWVLIKGPDAWRMQSLNRLEMIADAFLSVSTPSQAALPEILGHVRDYSSPLHSRVRENYSYLQHACSGNCSVLRCEGGWNAMVRIPSTRTDEQWALGLLEQQKVLVHPGYLFEIENRAFFVLSLLPEIQAFREGVQRMTQFLGSFPA